MVYENKLPNEEGNFGMIGPWRKWVMLCIVDKSREKKIEE